MMMMMVVVVVVMVMMVVLLMMVVMVVVVVLLLMVGAAAADDDDDGGGGGGDRYGGAWLNELPNFDTFWNSFMALFHLGFTEGWVELMQRCVDAVGPGVHPIQGYAPVRTLAFVM